MRGSPAIIEVSRLHFAEKFLEFLNNKPEENRKGYAKGVPCTGTACNGFTVSFYMPHPSTKQSIRMPCWGAAAIIITKTMLLQKAAPFLSFDVNLIQIDFAYKKGKDFCPCLDFLIKSAP